MGRPASAFSNHEAVILLNRYLVLSKRGMSRKQIAVQVSNELRQMAMHCGRNMDGSYRSIAGIMGRLVSMECAFTNIQKKRVVVPCLFTQIVDLYNNDRQKYDELLHEAEDMIEGTEQSNTTYAELVPEHELKHNDSNAIGAKLPHGYNGEGSLGVLKEFTLSAPPELTHTKPCSFRFANDESVTVQNWAEVFRGVLEKLSFKQMQKLMESFDTSIISSNGIGMRRPVEINTNVFVEMNLSSTDLIKRLKRFFDCCKMDSDALTVVYRNNKKMNSNISSIDETIIPEKLRDYIMTNYPNGMRFDDTVLRLIGDRLDIQIDEDICSALQGEMFKREDGLFFFDAMIADPDECMQIKVQTQRDIDTFGLCEIDVLYERFLAGRENTCIRDANDYVDFLMHLLPDRFRLAIVVRIKIVFRANVSKKESINTLTGRLIETITKKGSVTEDDLLTEYPVLSKVLLGKLLDKRSDEVIKTTINDIVCYQSVNGLGLDESFSETLNSVLERIEELDLQPSCEVIHTFLSIEYGQNLRDAYLIQDDRTLQRIIARYYTGKIPRAWKAGCFTEE